ncbi:MAG: sulfatase-like hydrolase/transferase [Candidatus Brocadiae bacterium]|nr:sulfatase-like hydrolase/transferase [Candidatus Brocadiia bacterium]
MANCSASRRRFLTTLGWGAGALALRGLARTTEAADKKPNFVIILADDMGYGDSSVYDGWINTPHMERLAAEGLKFTDFHSSGVVCSPTRAGLMTGRYQQRAGVPGVINADPKVAAHHTGLQTTEVVFPKLLKQAGYTCGIFGKWHLGYEKKYNPLYHGFDVFRGFVSGNIDYASHYDRMGMYDWWDGLEHAKEDGYSTHLITRHAVEFIERNQRRPFCCYVPHEAVHTPLQGPKDPPVRGPNKAKGRKVDAKRAYREMMGAMDDSIGAIVAALRRLGLADNTLVVFFSDNGGTRYGSNAPLRGGKGTVWEGGHREPAIGWWPGRIKPGTVTDQLCISLDVMPTLLELAGVPVPAGHTLDGVSLAPLLLEGKPLGKRQLFWNGRAMRDGQWKLVLGGRGGDGVGLYDLSKDIGEKTNLAAQHPERVVAMRAAVAAWDKDVAAGATRQPPPPPGAVERPKRRQAKKAR